MSKLLALEWDEREIRAVAGTPRDNDLIVDQIWRVPLPSAGGEVPPTTAEIGKTLAAAVAQHGLKRARALVTIGRSLIELKDLSLPPSPDDELPDLVRFQALREFNSLGDDWPLDFVPFPGDPEQPRTVLAAALPPSTLESIRQICHTAGLALDQVVVRPCAAATLVEKRLPDSRQVRLFVDLLADELDLTVLAGPTPEFMRTARLHSDLNEADLQKAILNEVRRTLAAASNRLHGRRIDSLMLCGDGPNATQFSETMERELRLPTVLFDPLHGCGIAAELQGKVPPHHSHFAPLIGLLVGAATNHAPLLDFLHPRKKPEPPSQSRVWMLAAALAATIVLGLGYWVFQGLNEKENELAALNTRIGKLEGGKKQNETIIKEAGEIDRWLAADVPLVLELKALSEKLPPAQELMLTNVIYSATKSGGLFTISGVVKDAKVIQKMTAELEKLNQTNAASAAAAKQSAPKKYVVSMQGVEDEKKLTGYTKAFKMTIGIEQPGPIMATYGPQPQGPSRPPATTPAAGAAKGAS